MAIRILVRLRTLRVAAAPGEAPAGAGIVHAGDDLVGVTGPRRVIDDAGAPAVPGRRPAPARQSVGRRTPASRRRVG